MLGRTKRSSGGFGSTGSSDKIFVSNVNDQAMVESVSMSVNNTVIIDSAGNNLDKIIIDTDLSESNDGSEEID